MLATGAGPTETVKPERGALDVKSATDPENFWAWEVGVAVGIGVAIGVLGGAGVLVVGGGFI